MRRVKHILSYVLVLSMCFTLFFFPINVYAESRVTDASVCRIASYQNKWYTSYAISNSDMPVYVCIARNKANNYAWELITASEASFKIASDQYNSNPSSCTTPTWNVSSSTQEGITMAIVNTNWGVDFRNVFSDIPVSDLVYNESSRSDWYDYFFGDGNIEPPGPSYGRVADIEYATRIVGSGLASADNIDRIVWNQSVDTNGNDLPTGARVQIRAVPGKYVGNTANDVLNKTYTDFVLDHSKQLIIVDIIASRGVYETKWSEVVDHFGFFPYSWVPNIQYLDNEYFKMGWIYQIRLQIEDYYSDWQNIYTATGSGASESQTITDSDEISQQLVQDINIVNQLNNTTNTNWYINETTINNSEYTENTNGKPWWAYLLEAILSLFQIGDGEQQTIINTNNLNIDLNDKLNEYNEIEDQQLNNLDTNLEAIEVESDMLENNKFVGSANWVAQQYTRMTNGTVIGSLIGFSLLFGLALIFIGKIR